VQWVGLVIVLVFFVVIGEVECHLLGLVDYRAVTVRHFSNVKLQHAGDGFKVLESARQEFLGSIGLSRVGPEYDYV